MSEIVATLFTVDARALDVIAREGERALDVIAREGEIELAFLHAGWRVDRLHFTPRACAELEQALRTARLAVAPEEETTP